MESLAALYHVTPENLALRRQFIGLDGDVVALLAALATVGPRTLPTRSRRT